MVNFGLYFYGTPANGAGRDLTDTAVVNVTSDTSATAKKMAMDEAYRQIILDTVSSFVSDKSGFTTLVKNANDSDLTNLISAISIDNEQQSATTYSANITMTVDRKMIIQWLKTNNISNSLTTEYNSVGKEMNIILSNGLSDWISLNNIFAEKNINFTTTRILNNKINGMAQVDNISDLVRVLQDNNWNCSYKNNQIKIWK